VHRPEAWRRLGEKLGLPEIAIGQPRLRPADSPRHLVVHSGASQSLRVWPLERYAEVLRRAQRDGWTTTVLCDAPQREAWSALGFSTAKVAQGMDELVDTIASATCFLGNDSGPGHIAALCGVPTFTIFGPQVPELFAPGHPLAAWIEGRPCRYKPCFDRCRFSEPLCLTGIDVESVWIRLEPWLNMVASRAHLS
jgi:ADP-heptose:LPS heptosyltransferase